MKTITRTIKLVKMKCIVYNTQTKQNEDFILYAEKTRNTEKKVAQTIKQSHPELRLVMIEDSEEINRTLSLPLEKFIELATDNEDEPADNH